MPSWRGAQVSTETTLIFTLLTPRTKHLLWFYSTLSSSFQRVQRMVLLRPVLPRASRTVTMLVLVMYRYLLKVKLLLCTRHKISGDGFGNTLLCSYLSNRSNFRFEWIFFPCIYIVIGKKHVAELVSLEILISIRSWNTVLGDFSTFCSVYRRQDSVVRTATTLRAGLPGLWIPTVGRVAQSV